MNDTTFFMHKLKCLSCSLHFVVCSDYEDWPKTGTTREMRVGEATNLIFCPECGKNGPFLHYMEEVPGFIFDSVPGRAELKAVHS